MHEYRVKAGPIPGGSRPVHLLVPIPPSTPEQTFVGLCSGIGCDPAEFAALNVPQRAWVFDVPSSGEAHFIYSFAAQADQLARDEHFVPVDGPMTRPSDELVAFVTELTKGCASGEEKLQKVLEFTASIFDYDHPERPFTYGTDRMPLLTQLTKGNCVDIHGFALTCLYICGVPAAYYAGSYFPGEATTTRGFHCWLASRLGGRVQYWDIAQHLKTGLDAVQPGLNPIGGHRVALSVGRGIGFDLNGLQVTLNHIGHPMWIYEDGTASGFGAETSYETYALAA